MSNIFTNAEFWKKLWRFIWEQFIPRLLSLVLGHPRAAPIAIGLVIASLFMASRYSQMATLQESLLQQSLDTRTSSTGPEALWTAEMPTCIKEDLGSDQISLNFSDQFRAKLKTTIEDLEAVCEKGCADRLNARDLSLIGDRPDQIVTDDKTDFLFFPMRLSGNPDLLSQVIMSKEKHLPSSLNDIATAIFVSQRIGDSLSAMLNTPVFACDLPLSSSPGSNQGCKGGQHCKYLDPVPVQVYFIDEYGLNRIVGRYGNKTLSKEYYRHQFSSNTNFATRPYYKPALVQAQDKLTEATGQVGKYFYVTDPYFDAAGNGLVVTLARGFSYPGLGRGALCFDLGLKAAKSLGLPLDTLDQLGSIARIAHCDIPFASSQKPHCKLDTILDASDYEARAAFRRSDSELQSALESKLETMITTQREVDSLSDVTGSLKVLGRWQAFDDSGKSQGSLYLLGNYLLSEIPLPDVVRASSSSWQLLVSAPLAPPKVSESEETADFLVFNVNVPAFRRRTALWGLGGLSALLLGLGIAGFVWELDSRTNREMYEALMRVSKIMAHSGLAFAWLDTKDRIVQASDEFVKSLGFATLAELFSNHPSKEFKSLINKDSKAEYETVEIKRKRGEPVTPYSLYFDINGGVPKKFTVVAASVPSSTNVWYAVPATFGVLLEGDVKIADEIK